MKVVIIVQLLLFRIENQHLQLFLIPSGEQFAVPSLEVVQHQDLEQAIYELIESIIKSNQKIYFRQMYTLGKIVEKDMKVFSTSYLSLVSNDQLETKINGRWFSIEKNTIELNEMTRKSLLALYSKDIIIKYEINDEATLNYIAKESNLLVDSNSKLAFDHIKTVNMAMDRLQHGIASSGLLFNLLSSSFTLREAQLAYEAVMNKKVDTPNFRRDIVKMLTPTGVNKKSGKKEAMTYRFNPLFQYLREDL